MPETVVCRKQQELNAGKIYIPMVTEMDKKIKNEDSLKVRPEYLKKLDEIEAKGKFLHFKNVEELDKYLSA